MHIDLEFLAGLAKVRVSACEAGELKRDLEPILERVKRLKEVDVTGVAPTFRLAAPGSSDLREDVLRPCLIHQWVLSRAPATKGPYLLVPREGIGVDGAGGPGGSGDSGGSGGAGKHGNAQEA